MAVNSCVLIGFLGAMFIRLASKKENSRNENFEREDGFKEGATSADDRGKRHFGGIWCQAKIFCCNVLRLKTVCIMQPADAAVQHSKQHKNTKMIYRFYLLQTLLLGQLMFLG